MDKNPKMKSAQKEQSDAPTQIAGNSRTAGAMTAVVDPTNKTQAGDLREIGDEATLKKLGLYTPAALDRLVLEEHDKSYVLEKFITVGSVNIAAGDSGLGKSALFYQLGLCVAAGKPWLGFQTTKGPVVYLDLENSQEDSKNIRDNLAGYLGLQILPETFLTNFGSPNFLKILKDVRPSLIIIDSLRAYEPNAENDNAAAGEFLKRLRSLARTHATAFLFVHHIKKPGKDAPPSLEDTPANQWLIQASGARALINQTDFRLGIDSAVGAGRRLKKTNPLVADEMALIVRGHVRVRGEFGPLYLARSFNQEGQPIGYKKASAIELLNNPDQQAAFDRLPTQFSFGEAKKFYGRQDQATTDFLEKCIRLDLLQRREKGQYEKKSPTNPVE